VATRRERLGLSPAQEKAILTLSNIALKQITDGTADLGRLSAALREVEKEVVEVVPLTWAADLLKEGWLVPPKGLALGALKTLEEISGGLYGMWTIGGEPGVGKSTLAWQLGLMLSGQIPVVYYDFENTAPVLMDRTRQIFGGDIEVAKNHLSRVALRHDIRHLRGDVEQLEDPALFIIDSIQKLPTSAQNRRTELDKWLHYLEQIKQQGHYVIMVSEVGRSVYSKEQGFVGAFKETGEIEYTSDFALQLLESDRPSVVEVHVVKNRHREPKGHKVDLRRVRSWWFVEAKFAQRRDTL
jgi:hypothetical protein